MAPPRNLIEVVLALVTPARAAPESAALADEPAPARHPFIANLLLHPLRQR